MKVPDMERDSFIFYRSFFEALSPLDKEDKASLMDAICLYALDGSEVPLSPIAKAMFSLIKPQLQANRARYENGIKPKQKGSKREAKPKQGESQAEGNVNDNVNDNENVNQNANANHPTPKGELWACDDRFSQIVEAYKSVKPEAVDADRAYTVWRNPKNGHLPSHATAILNAIHAFAQSDGWKKDGGAYIPTFSNFLLGGKWRNPPELKAAREGSWEQWWQENGGMIHG